MSSSCEVISPAQDPGSPKLIPVSPMMFSVSSPASAISLLSLNTGDRQKTREKSKEQPISPINGRPFIPARYTASNNTQGGSRPIPIRTKIHPTGSTPGSPHLSPVSAGTTPSSFNLNKIGAN